MKKFNLSFLLLFLSISISFSFISLKIKSEMPIYKKLYQQKTTSFPIFNKNSGISSNNKLSNKKVFVPLMWSIPSTWTSFGATKPVAGSSVIIPAGIHIILDENPPVLSNITINGTLEFKRMNLTLTTNWIMVMGKLEIGNLVSPFLQKAIINVTGADMNESEMGMGTRGIMVMGGELELHGTPPTLIKTKINNHAAAGSSNLTLLNPVNWNVNDQLVIAPTDFYGAGNGAAQRSKIVSLNTSTSVNIQDGLNAQRWGKLQYLTSTGMSLSSGTLPANISPGTPTTLDERAIVANLSRNIVVQSPDDAIWQNYGFGCHIMVMRMGNTQGIAHINGVEIRRGGQAGKLGRYPFHWHMLSYNGSTTLSDATGQYIRNSVINQSAQRGIVIHGTNGTEVSNNVVYDVRGHGIFTEDASERRNIISGNLVLKVRNQLPNYVLKLHETDIAFGASGYWISNPDNTIINNNAGDCEGFGFWLAFPIKTFGSSSLITLNPSLMNFGVFNNNMAFSNQLRGIHLDDAEIDELGNTAGLRYTSTTDMQTPQWPYPTVETYELSDYSVWKNNRGGIWNRSNSPRNHRATSADNRSKFFSGASDNVLSGAIDKTLVIGESLNYNMNGVIIPPNYGAEDPSVAFASYHSTFSIENNVIVNFPAIAGKSSGAFALDDYYLIPVDKGSIRNPNNIIINSHPGVRILPSEPQFTFGVVWDFHNYLGGPANQDNYYVFNNPFFTYGLSTHLPQSNPDSGGVVVNGPFYGFSNYNVNRINRVYDKIQATRTTYSGIPVGNWVVEGGMYGDLLGNMRHFATHPTGFYYLDFPTIDNINEFALEVSNMTNNNDYQVLSIEYDPNHTIDALFTSIAYNNMEFGNTLPMPTNNAENRIYQPVASFADVVRAPTGEVYWQDTINSKVWIKVRGGLNSGDPSLSPNHDNNLYKSFVLRAFGSPSVLSNNQFLNDNSIKVYPNPTISGIINITDCNNRKFKLFDISGRLVKTDVILNETIDISECKTGSYFLQIELDSKIVIKKVIKI